MGAQASQATIHPAVVRLLEICRTPMEQAACDAVMKYLLSLEHIIRELRETIDQNGQKYDAARLRIRALEDENMHRHKDL